MKIVGFIVTLTYALPITEITVKNDFFLIHAFLPLMLLIINFNVLQLWLMNIIT